MDSSSTAGVRLESVSVTYEAGRSPVYALRDLSLVIPERQFACILGPSGCGKTTLFQLVTGLRRPDKGRVWVGDTEVSTLSPRAAALFRRESIGSIFQFFNLSPALTLEENVALPLLAGKARLKDLRERIAEILAELGLDQYQGRSLAELSGGEMQRVAIARALLVNPPVLIADEPTGNLDSEAGRGILEIFQTLAREQGTTILLLTHDLRATSFADRIIRLRDGRIEEDLTQST